MSKKERLSHEAQPAHVSLLWYVVISMQVGPYGSRHAHIHNLLFDILVEQNVGLSKKMLFLNRFVPRQETRPAYRFFWWYTAISRQVGAYGSRHAHILNLVLDI